MAALQTHPPFCQGQFSWQVRSQCSGVQWCLSVVLPSESDKLKETNSYQELQNYNHKDVILHELNEFIIN